MEGRRESFGEPSSAGQSATQRWKTSRDDGIIARSVNQIFETLEKGGNEFSVRVSHLELYNEELRDLLNTTNKGLKLYEDASSGGKVVVHSLEEKMVYTPQDIFDILQRSWEERRTAETEMNKNSSRSHCIFSITIHMKEASPEGEDLIKIGKLNLVDLAGSENIGRSGADKVQSRKQEACMINKSLLTLGRVITALTDGLLHVPYRESKLTRLLQDSLGGTTKTCIIATISPASGSIEETLSTLDYAHRAKNIKNRPECNAKMSKREVLKEFTMEIHVLKAQLDAMRRQQGVYLPLDQFNQMEAGIKEQAEKIQFFEDMIQQKEKDLAELQEMFDRQGQQLDRTQSKLAETAESLTKTTDQLKVTSDALASTKESLDEHRFLLHEHEETETKFHEEANVVLGTLDVTMGDILGLFSKIERKDNLELANSTSWGQFRDSLLTRVKSVENKVSNFIANEQARYGELHEKIEQFIGQKDNELNTVLSRLSEFETATRNHFESFSNGTELYCQDANDRMNSVSTADSEFERKFESTIQQFILESKDDFSKLQASLQIQQQELSSWTQVRRERMTDALDRTKQFSRFQSTQLESVKASTKEVSESQIAKLESHKAALEAFVASQHEENQKVQRDLMSRIQQLVETYFAQHHMVTAGTVRSINQSLQGSMVDFRSHAGEICDNVDSVLRHTSAHLEDAEESFAQALADLQQHSSHESLYFSNTSESLAKFEASSTRFANLSFSDVKQRSATRAAELGGLEAVANNFLASQKALTDQASTNTSNKLENEIRLALLQQQVASSEFFGKICTDFDSTRVGISEFQDDFSSNSDAVVGNLTSFSLARYQATGTTPQKKDYSFPRDLARTKPKDILLQEWRKLREAGLDVDSFLKTELASEATSTSTLVIDDDSSSDVSSCEEGKDLSEPALVAAPLVSVAAPVAAPLSRASSSTKITPQTAPSNTSARIVAPASKPNTTGMAKPSARGTVSVAKKAATAASAQSSAPVSKTLSRQGSKGQQLKEIVNQGK
jgi:kinesin family member 11